MPEVDFAELRAEMETEREWREVEMRLFRNQVAALSTEDQRRIARKALVVMLYAHFEGVTKGLLSMYVNRLNALSLRVSDRIDALPHARGLRGLATKRDCVWALSCVGILYGDASSTRGRTRPSDASCSLGPAYQASQGHECGTRCLSRARVGAL